MAAIPISTIVDVQISLEATRVTQAGFGTPLIFGSTQTPPWSPQIREYFNLTSVLADGFNSSSPEYRAASAIFGQAISPRSLKIAQQGVQVAQIRTLEFSAALITGNSIALIVDGVSLAAVPFNTNNATTLTDIATALQATAGIGTAVSDGVDTITMTAAVAGIPFTVSALVTGGASQATGVVTTTTQNHGIIEDILAVQLVDDNWYGLLVTSRVVGVVDQVAAFIETQKKIFVTSSTDTGIITAGNTTSIAYRYHALGYRRTMVLYNPDNTTYYADGAELGNELARDPGTYTMNLKTLVGIPVYPLTATQYNYAIGSSVRANVYVEIGGVNVLRAGTVASGLFIDEIRFIDWLQARIEERIFFQLVNTPKIPYTDPGVQIIINQIQAVLQNGVKVGGLAADPKFVISAPLVADQSPADRADRYFPGITFTATLSSAIHDVQIRGTVTI
jgi:hypothetical protein